MVVKATSFYKSFWDRIRRKRTHAFIAVGATEALRLKNRTRYWKLKPAEITDIT